MAKEARVRYLLDEIEKSKKKTEYLTKALEEIVALAEESQSRLSILILAIAAKGLAK